MNSYRGIQKIRKLAQLWNRTTQMISDSLIDPRNYQPALPLPEGFSRKHVHDCLTAVSIDGSASGELYGYASADCDRFLRTLDMVPQGASGKLLEIGANPYFTTLLLHRFRPALELTLVNYFGPGHADATQRVVFPGFDGAEEQVDFSYVNLNVEQSVLPYEDHAFDYVIFCEVLEHMTHDPLKALLEIKRVIKPGGTLILTTPNAARLESIINFIEGRNIYDPYSAYGPYGRHNREYTRHELHQLVEHCGFCVEISYTGNVYPDRALEGTRAETLNAVLSQTKNREHDLGQYLFTRWKNIAPANEKLPSWLYRSYSTERMAGG